MSREVLMLVDALAREKSVAREVVFLALESALASATKKKMNQDCEIRVEIDRERQNQALLNALNERAALQLRLQQTVEGLSVAAISYYAIGLIGYVFKAIEKAGAPVKAELATGLAVVPVALCVWFLLHRAQRHFKGDDSPK